MPGDLYDVVAISKAGRVIFYVDRLSDNSPVTDASVEVTSGASKHDLERLADGTYVIDASKLPNTGAIELIVSIQGPDGSDLVGGTLDLTDQASHSRAATHDAGGTRLAGLLAPLAKIPGLALLGIGIAVGILVGAFLPRSRRGTASLLIAAIALTFATSVRAGPGGPGHTHGDEQSAVITSDAPQRLPDGSVFLPKPTQRLLGVRTLEVQVAEVPRTITLPGRVIADPNRSGVVQSINGGRISASEGGLPRLGQKVRKGELLALVDPPINAADETTITDRIGEIDQRIKLAEERLTRLVPLAATNSVPKTQVTDLETELASLRQRRAKILTQRRQTEELRAPVDGEIASIQAVLGQVVQPQDAIFRIVDPASVWVEALAGENFDPSLLRKAVAIARGSDGMTLGFRGIGRVLQQHLVQTQFAIENPPSGLRIGEPVTVLLQGEQALKGLPIPREAVVRAHNGEMIVWARLGSERFAPRAVRTEPLDGKRVLIVGGIDAGSRIATTAAELINQVR
jgi:RND family efflux transporter MFP subunit